MKTILFSHLISLRNTLYFHWKKSPKRFLVTVAFLCIAFLGIYLGIWGGLQFITSLGGLGTVIIKKIIFLLFSILFFMVAISFGVLFYGTGFRSKETAFLLTLPIREEKVIFYKFIETMLFASWIPLLGMFLFFLAYSQIAGANIVFVLLSLLYILPFLLISCFLGYIGVLFISRFLRLKKSFWVTGFILLISLLIYTGRSTPSQSKNFFYLLSEDMVFLRISKIWFLPFSWPGYGLVAVEDSDFKRALIYLANLWSLGILCLSYVSSFKGVFAHIYYDRFPVTTSLKSKKDYIRLYVEKLKVLPGYMRSFIIKDIKLFVREPSLWLQFLIFFGILFFYFLNLRRFSYHLLEDIWRSLLTFLNTFSILCIASAMSIRFVFPQWSLEGRSFWVIKLSPISLKRIFVEKFVLSFTTLFLISISLILIANYNLNVKGIFFNITLFIISVATFTMVTISLGLGAYFANFHQEYYLKAVESLGGFITLTFNFGYTFLTTLLFAAITHLYFTGRLNNLNKTLNISLLIWSLSSLGISFFVSWLGMKKLEAKEY